MERRKYFGSAFATAGATQGIASALVFLASALAVIALSASGVLALDITGQASIVDGDTIEIRGERIRLHGIDAPESSQLCCRPDGERWRCGQRSALALDAHLDGKTVKCVGRGRDRYDRPIARCSVGESDIGAWLVRNGWAVAYRQYSRDYLPDERAAEEERAGVWSGDFAMPWRWRRGTRTCDARR